MAHNLTRFVQQLFVIVALGMLQAALVGAHGDELDEVNHASLDDTLRHNSTLMVIGGAVAVTVLIGLTALLKSRIKKKKKFRDMNLPPSVATPLFVAIVAVILIVTIYVAGATIYLNLQSLTKGPVHWHADYEIWNCGQPIELVDPVGMSNRVGESVMHEHGDNRMHVEGVVTKLSDVGLGNFFRSVGGELQAGMMRLPTNGGDVTMKDGELCNGKPGTLQAFVIKDMQGIVVQEKLSDYSAYVLSDHSQVPPGDCIILDFDSTVNAKTAHMCESYRVALQNGGLHGG